MKNKLKIVACSLFLSVGTVTALVVLDNDNSVNIFNSSTVKAGAPYYLTLNSSNRYVDGNQNISTDLNNGALVGFAYTNASQSSSGHVVLADGGTLKNTDQFTSLSYFIPSFTLGNGASLKFRASNDGVNWGDYASIKPYADGISSSSFNVPYMRFVEFKAEGGSVDIESISYCYTCSESDNQGLDNYEIGTSYVDSNTSYTTNDTYNGLSGGLVVYKNYNGGAKDRLDSAAYEVSVKNPSGVEINKASNLVAGQHTVTISRKDKAFADVSYNFTVVADRFTVTTDLTTPKEIHTERQKTYLAYEGAYDTMDSSLYPDGNQLLSDPLPVNLAWNFTPASGKSLSKYSVTFGQKADLSDGYEVIGNTNKSIDLYNVYLGTNYFKINANYSDNSVESSAIKTFVVDGTAPRNLAIGGMTNCRDMGGRATIYGGVVKQGLIYRTSGYKYDYSTTITNAGKEVMLGLMGVKTEINLADKESNNLKLTGTTTYNAFMDYANPKGVSKHHFSRNAESVKNVFKILADESKYPVYYHCRIGTDRTGLIGNLVTGLLGVPLNMIYQDYLFSNFGNIQDKRYIGSQAGEDDISIYMQEINSMPGDNFQEKVYNTLLAIGVPSSTLDTVIDLLTEGTKPNNAHGQIGLNPNQMVLNGTTATYTSKSNIVERSEPEYYATLSQNASASYVFTTSESGTAKIYGYLGNTEHSTSKYINTSVSVSIDNVNVTIPTKTFAEAGMGNISGRTNYYFVPLGEVSNLSAGEHTIKITGLANNMKLGRLSVFGVPATVNENQGNTPEPVVPISLSISNASSSGCHSPSTKLGGDGGDATWSVNNTTIPAGNYKVSIEFKSTSGSHSSRTFMDGSKPTYTVYINGTGYGPSDTTSTRETLGIGANDFKNVTYIDSLIIPSNLSEVKIGYTGTNGYRMYCNSISFTALS